MGFLPADSASATVRGCRALSLLFYSWGNVRPVSGQLRTQGRVSVLLLVLSGFSRWHRSTELYSRRHRRSLMRINSGVYIHTEGLPGGSVVKNLHCRRPWFSPWVWKIPWRREWQLTPVLLLGESHGQRSLPSYSPWHLRELDATEWLTLSCPYWGFPSGSVVKSIHLPMQEPQELMVQPLGREDPLEEEMATHSSIPAWEIPWTGGWWAMVHGVAKSWTWLDRGKIRSYLPCIHDSFKDAD